MIHLACDPKYFLIKNNTNGHAGNEKLMLDIDNNKYKKCFSTSRDIFDLLSEKTNHSHSQLQKTAFSLVKSGLALGSPGYSYVLVWLSPCREGPIHRKMIVDCPLVITSKVKPFSRLDKTRKEEWLVQPVFCIVDTGSCFVWVLISPLQCTGDKINSTNAHVYE